MGHEELIGFDLEKADGGDSGEGVNGSRNIEERGCGTRVANLRQSGWTTQSVKMVNGR